MPHKTNRGIPAVFLKHSCERTCPGRVGTELLVRRPRNIYVRRQTRSTSYSRVSIFALTMSSPL